MQIKGTAVRSMLLGLEQVSGPADVARVKAAMPPGIRRQIEPLVLASKYYPVEVSAALQEAIRTELGGGSCTMNHRIGAEAARIDFGGVYTVFLRFMDYEKTLRRLDRAWRQYNSQGEVVWKEIGKTSARAVIQGATGFNEPMWHAIAGRVEAVLLLAGAKKASTKVADWSAEGCTLEVAWTP
jgi:uncharacterized protein (TIGR02265 family)